MLSSVMFFLKNEDALLTLGVDAAGKPPFNKTYLRLTCTSAFLGDGEGMIGSSPPVKLKDWRELCLKDEIIDIAPKVPLVLLWWITLRIPFLTYDYTKCLNCSGSYFGTILTFGKVVLLTYLPNKL